MKIFAYAALFFSFFFTTALYGNCGIRSGSFDHWHSVPTGSFTGEMRISYTGTTRNNGVVSKHYSGRWWVGSDRNAWNKVTIQYTPSSGYFSLSRVLSPGGKQDWIGDCRNGVAEGSVFDPSVGNGDFRINF